MKSTLTAFAIYDTELEIYRLGAKGQIVFGDTGTAKRSFAHTGALIIASQELKLREVGQGHLIDDNRLAEKEYNVYLSDKKANKIKYQDYYLSNEFLDLQQNLDHCRHKYLTALILVKNVERLTFAKQSRFVIHKLSNADITIL